MPTIIYKIGILLLIIAMIFGYGYYTGKGVCETKELKQTVKTVERVRYVKQKVASYPDPVLDERLRRWER